MKGLGRIPLIGRKFARNQKGIYVPKKEIVIREPRQKVQPRATASSFTEKPHKKKAAQARHAANKRARAARRKNRRVK